MIKREEGGRNLFAGPSALAHYAQKPNASPYVPREKKGYYCEHCKRAGHTKDRCWILNPHLKPSRYKENPKRGMAMTVGHEQPSIDPPMSFTTDELKGFKQLLLALNNKESGY
ncbi:PREDICTED: uncharacterized protein LOC104808431 [Tarenaya hassleriana]|uniref:uncharacterized protein LOC104808431 n=1 Tax=Tarenaya hassleriana TaxID=28532 RepID=UPI00053C3CE0|nr:PREDICTED: uncharacterized protein LOC104808431 [Tarenaya hassleriana]